MPPESLERISLLLPTRQRPGKLARLADSAKATAAHPDDLELVTYVDDDDHSYDDLELVDWNWTQVHGPREHAGQVNLSVKWNECWLRATGDIFMHCGDDIVFRTPGWDSAIRAAINDRPGKICFAWCDDYGTGQDRSDFGTHGFIHRNWTDTIGRFVPPYFVSDYNDTWFNDVAQMLTVRTYLPGYLTEHMHHIFQKTEIDTNTRERLERHSRERPDAVYYSPRMEQERREEAEKLQKFIDLIR